MENGSERKVEGGIGLEYEKEERKKYVKKEDGKFSVERTFENKEVPSWRKQLTMRAFAVSFMMSVMFCLIVMKLNLATGIIPSLNVSAGLLGFFFVKIWTKVIAKSGMLMQPCPCPSPGKRIRSFRRVVASSGIAFSGMIPILFADRKYAYFLGQFEP